MGNSQTGRYCGLILLADIGSAHQNQFVLAYAPRSNHGGAHA